jgi:hypothetical protein
MADQTKCRALLDDVGQAINGMFTPLPTGEEAIQAGRDVAAKIRAELAAKDAMTPEERVADGERWERVTRVVRG